MEHWRSAYNTLRPHSWLDYRPPAPQAIRPPRPLLRRPCFRGRDRSRGLRKGRLDLWFRPRGQIRHSADLADNCCHTPGLRIEALTDANQSNGFALQTSTRVLFRFLNTPLNHSALCEPPYGGRHCRRSQDLIDGWVALRTREDILSPTVAKLKHFELNGL